MDQEVHRLHWPFRGHCFYFLIQEQLNDLDYSFLRGMVHSSFCFQCSNRVICYLLNWQKVVIGEEEIKFHGPPPYSLWNQEVFLQKWSSFAKGVPQAKPRLGLRVKNLTPHQLEWAPPWEVKAVRWAPQPCPSRPASTHIRLIHHQVWKHS